MVLNVKKFKNEHEITIYGTTNNPSILFQDCDNDMDNELIVGTLEGKISIYKHSTVAKVASGYNFGMITTLLCGALCYPGHNNLIAISGKGEIHLFEISATLNEKASKMLLSSCYSQKIPANTKCGLLIDIDGDGICEIILGLTDRIVRSFKWTPSLSEINELGTQDFLDGKFVACQKWELIKQIGNLSFDHDLSNSSMLEPPKDSSCTYSNHINNYKILLCSQPGTSYVILPTQSIPDISCTSDTNTNVSGGSQKTEPIRYISIAPIDPQDRHSDLSTEICGGLLRAISADDEKFATSHYLAMITLDGKLYVLVDENVVFSIHLHETLFGLGTIVLNISDSDKLSETSLGERDWSANNELFVFSSWTGNTYFLEPPNKLTKHVFKKDVRAFSHGYYSFKKHGMTPCILYVTMDNNAHLYHD